MLGLVEGETPSYISSQSADVILSDVRPFRLKTEALHSINALLDEFLCNILSNAKSLLTDKLRTSLLSLLPTSLGKEALLEAEVELRAYWDRTAAESGRGPELQDDSETFHLQRAFELLRLKCEAYSTLNESDEDPFVEERIQGQFIQTVSAPPSAALLAPAALYLTAILEAVCEHVLTNVGRVAARDSSRVSANVNDLFTALCEDDSIYGLFKSMKVYEQIELLSKGPVKSRRSKSFTRSDLSTTLTSRTGSPHQDLLLGKDSISTPRSRLSSEVSSSITVPSMPGITTPAPRTSSDKARSLKLFKNSLDNDSLNGYGHKKSESGISEKMQDDGQRSMTLTEESVLQQEFDDLMRSSSTMKVSLTPDRLKTMEVYKQEQDLQKQTRKRPTPLSLKDSDSASLKRPSLRHVDSIIEDDEELAFPQPPSSNFSRIRQGSVATPPSAPVIVASNNRTRSISTSSLRARGSRSKHKQQFTAPSAFPNPPHDMTRPTKPKPIQVDGIPPRTRKRQGNRESFDLDDVMAGVDDEGIHNPLTPARSPVLPRGPAHVSSSTRDLVEFLAQGPPDELGDSLYSGTPSSASLDAKPKGDRLRRMISKLSIGNGEKSKNGAYHNSSKFQSTKSQLLPPVVAPALSRPPKLAVSNSFGGLSSLANRPIPPRPPRPPTPPSEHEISPPPSPVIANTPAASYSPATSSFKSSNRPPSPAIIPPRQDSREASRQPTVNGSGRPNCNGNANEQIKQPGDLTPSKLTTNGPFTQATNEVGTSSPPQIWKVQTNVVTTPTPVPSGPLTGLSPTDVAHLHRLMHCATSADECRLLLSMILARHKISPSEDATHSIANETVASPEDIALERSLAGYLLGDEGPLEDGAPRVTSNRSSTTSTVSVSIYDDDSSVDPINPIPPVLPPLSIDSNSDNNTLVGEMKV